MSFTFVRKFFCSLWKVGVRKSTAIQKTPENIEMHAIADLFAVARQRLERWADIEDTSRYKILELEENPAKVEAAVQASQLLYRQGDHDSMALLDSIYQGRCPTVS